MCSGHGHGQKDSEGFLNPPQREADSHTRQRWSPCALLKKSRKAPLLEAATAGPGSGD